MKTRSPIRNKALAEAVRRAGGQTQLASLLGVRQSTLREWLVVNGKPVAEKCPDIERHTGVRCEDLRPDVFGALSRLRASARRSQPVRAA
jgi:DNA-binding transcriptional regulator YdaS (Cro superfamily)